MWKKWLAFAAILAFAVLLDPTPTPAQPGPGQGERREWRFGGPPGSGTPGAFPAPGTPGGPGAFTPGSFPPPGGGMGGPGFERRSFGPPGGGMGGPPGGGMGERPAWGGPPGGGMGGPPGGGMGGPPGGGMGSPPGGSDGRRRGMDPEQGWTMLQRMTGGSGDTIDLGKIPPQTQAMLKGWAERSGGIPLPESGVMTKAQYLDHFARSEQARAEFAARGSSGAPGAPGGSSDFGRSRDGFSRDGFNREGWGQGGWGQGGWGQGGGDWSQGRGGEKKDVEEERPVALRYGKFPEAVKAALPGWYDEFDTDKDAQVSLYEWRKGGKEMKEFLEMDLNGDGLVTPDEYLRYARAKNIGDKLTAFEKGERESGGWGLYSPLDAKTDGGGERPKWGGPGGGGPPGSGGPPSFGTRGDRSDRGSDKGSGSDRDKGGSDREKGKNPWSKRP